MSIDWICGCQSSLGADFSLQTEQRVIAGFGLQPGGWFASPQLMMVSCLVPGQRTLLTSDCEGWKLVSEVADDQRYTQWLEDAAALAREHFEASFVFCLSGVVQVAEQQACVCEDSFAQARQQQTLFRCCTCCSTTLARLLAFCGSDAMPKWDDSITATLRKLPGVDRTENDSLVLLYNVPEESVPPCLFHLLELTAATAVT